MAFVFTPTCPGTGPWYIDREDCIGDSLVYINANTGYLDCKVNSLSSELTTGLISLSSQPRGVTLQSIFFKNAGTASTNNVQTTLPTTATGVEILSATITPVFSDSIVKVAGLVTSSNTNGTGGTVLGIFKDSGTNAVATFVTDGTYSSNTMNTSFMYYDTISSLTPVTYKVRMYVQQSGTVYLNRSNVSNSYSDTLASYITIDEIRA